MRVAIRRWGDKCFHLVDEEVEEGYILDGHLIRREDVVDRREVEGSGAAKECNRRVDFPDQQAR